jgi:hypothetical protein
MSKIWFFGDSYVTRIHESQSEIKSWTLSVHEAFPEHDSENLALSASSIDYLYFAYEQKRKHFSDQDIVIMSLTTIHRLFLRRHDETSSPIFLQHNRMHKRGPMEVIDEDHPWYNYFLLDLFNPEAHKAKVNLFLNSLQYDAMRKGIKIIVLPINYFDYLDLDDKDSITIGKTTEKTSLMTVTEKQYDAKLNIKLRGNDHWYNHQEGIEYDRTLANHLTPRNNEILANKVIRNIKTNEPIDLTTEWEYT